MIPSNGGEVGPPLSIYFTSSPINRIENALRDLEELFPVEPCNVLKLNKININDASKKELATHPYISWNLANAILNYKVQHGDYDSLSKIKQIHLVNDDLYRKIVPYITLD